MAWTVYPNKKICSLFNAKLHSAPQASHYPCQTEKAAGIDISDFVFDAVEEPEHEGGMIAAFLNSNLLSIFGKKRPEDGRIFATTPEYRPTRRAQRVKMHVLAEVCTNILPCDDAMTSPRRLRRRRV